MSSLGWYEGQMHKARELAVKELGAEKAALMNDGDIAGWIDEHYAIFWGDYEDDELEVHKADEETIALIPNDVFHGIVDSIVWLQR